ncbi:high mobility group B protein 6-like [Salvia divinorum]|uniref:High mobility group B protein 6-like n=1 Tax=Salvia divinorum TaxID=28513 RepID=A0ABD1HA70_SALDI
MAAVAEIPTFAPTKKGRTKKALKPKAVSSNEANIAAGAIPEHSPVASKGKEQPSDASSFEKQLQEMQEQLEKLKIEKEQTEEMLKAKEEQLETRDREQEKLKIELRKLQKIKEFKPTVTIPIGLGIKDLEQEKKEKKKGGKKKPSAPYVLWCKDQWNEVKEANPDADFKAMSNLLGAKMEIHYRGREEAL